MELHRLHYDGPMAEVIEILHGAIAILDAMEEERHDARYYVLMAAIDKVLDCIED